MKYSIFVVLGIFIVTFSIFLYFHIKNKPKIPLPTLEQLVSDAGAAAKVDFKENQTVADIFKTPEGKEEKTEKIEPKEYVVELRTNVGTIQIKLFKDEAPKTVENFVNLSRSDFYDKTIFHRVIPGFMIQGGDPLSRFPDKTKHGTGGPPYSIPDEITDIPMVRGALAMANRGPNTGGSQFFILTAPQASWLQGKHTIFGVVSYGMELVDAISKVQRDATDHPINDIVIENVVIR